jgi:hypothetical protein
MERGIFVIWKREMLVMDWIMVLSAFFIRCDVDVQHSSARPAFARLKSRRLASFGRHSRRLVSATKCVVLFLKLTTDTLYKLGDMRIRKDKWSKAFLSWIVVVFRENELDYGEKVPLGDWCEPTAGKGTTSECRSIVNEIA